MRVRAWLLAVLALAILPGGCEKKRGTSLPKDLHDAAFRGHREVIELLLAHGVDPNTKNNRGRTPWMKPSGGSTRMLSNC